MTSRRLGLTPDQSGSPSVTGLPSRKARANGSATTPEASAPTRSSGWLVGAVRGRTCATHHHSPVFSGTHRVRSAKARSASSCQSATSRRAWSTCDGLDAGPRFRRSERLLMVLRAYAAAPLTLRHVVEASAVGSLRVEPATPEDFPRIAELTGGVYRAEGLAPVEYQRELRDVAGRADRAGLLVARDGGTVGGRGAPGVRGGGTGGGSVALVLAGEFGEITDSDEEAAFRMLVVDPAARGRGVGELLVRDCLDRARAAGKRRMVLSTEPSMRSAHRLYERLGFARLPERDWSPLSGVQLLAYGLAL